MAHIHEHGQCRTGLNRAFVVGIVLNLLFVGAEFAAGMYYNSVGLMSDAGHNLSDVAGLALAWLALGLSQMHVDGGYTYGLKKATVLASLMNGVLLVLAVVFILWESVEKFFSPQEVDGAGVALVAGIGVLINGLTAWFFVKEKERDLNVKGAYLHMLADALVSVGVLVSGLLIRYTGWYLIDPLVGLLVGLVIIFSTWGLLRESVRLTLDGIPAGTDPKEIEKLCLGIPGVEGIHHVHIWGISTTETALTAHIVIRDACRMETVKGGIREALAARGIGHVTLETEVIGDCCSERCCI
ncbi:MAG: cation diffusion facilitator family transporter [Tannerellaceae bacterium]|jgi:cobalt-zinc-cadmium efflux system protein|nr:cation diffusion facilitator family transporter [Tannerellaceae bacterium]